MSFKNLFYSGGMMDRLVKLALGCALGGLCLSAQAALIDSVRVGGKAYLLSDTHLYRYDAAAGSVEYTLSLNGAPVALSASDSALFIAYEDKLEKRNFNGSVATDPVSSGPLTRNFVGVSDVEVYDTEVYVSFLEGKALHELNTSDLSPKAGPGEPYYSLSQPMKQLVAYDDAGNPRFYSPIGKNLGALEWPASLDGDGKVIVNEMEADEDAAGFLPAPEKLFIVEAASPEIYMDNGSGWRLDGTHEIGWINGQAFRFLDYSSDGNWSVVRDKVTACEPLDDLGWMSDLVHYNTIGDFVSRSKVGSNGRAFEVVHLWGASPYAHLFREGDPGQLVVEAHARSAGLPFDDGKPPVNIAANATLSEFQLAQGVTEQQVALDDEVTKAYVLHQGNARCAAVIRVYDLINEEWIQTIPLRWRPKAIAMVGGASPSSSDDMLAVVYENSYVVYGSSDVLVSYIDINDPDPEEDPATFKEYGVTHSNPSMVQGTRHAVLYQLEVVNAGSLITAWSPQGNMATYQDCEAGGTACGDPRNIDMWRARAELGEMPGMILKSGEDIRVLQFTEAADSFTFDAPFETYTLDESVTTAKAPLYFSPDMELFTLGLDENTALFRRSTQAYTEGKASDFLPLTMDVATWSETEQGTSNRFALYSLAGGDVQGNEAATLQRWVMELGNDGHFEFDSASSADLPGKPVLIKVIEPVQDDLLLSTVYQDQVLFTSVNKTLSDAPDDFEPGGDGSNGGNNGGGGNGGGSGGGSVSGSGFSDGGDGGSITWLFAMLALLAGIGRRPA